MEAKRKVKIKTLDNKVYTLEVNPDVSFYLLPLNPFRS